VKPRAIIKLVPARLRAPIGAKYNEIFYKRHDLSQDDKRIRELFNRHLGERCFIVATGPSLKKTDLALIKDEIVFGVNKLYLALDKLDINPKYWVVINRNIINYYKKLLKLNVTIFLGGNAGNIFLKKRYSKEPIVMRHLGRIHIFKKVSKDLTKGTYGDGSVVFEALQIAYYMGFKEIYLVGVDCDYSKDQHVYEEKCSKEYLKKNATKPWATVFKSYKIVKDEFEKDGREIYNCTVGGSLEVFERKKLEKVVK
jgi:hypothetical protein